MVLHPRQQVFLLALPFLLLPSTALVFSWLAILYPAIGFALWHLAPRQVFSEGSKFAFIFSTFFLGLANGFIAYQTGSALWPAISHSLGGILALGGAVAPSMLALFSRPDS